jgi:hypothetical protein
VQGIALSRPEPFDLVNAPGMARAGSVAGP